MKVMNEKPILFNTEMVRAVLAGDKTQTRRPMKSQPPGEIISAEPWIDGLWRIEHKPVKAPVGEYVGLRLRCPFGDIGTLLWVRETWATDYLSDDKKPLLLGRYDSDIYYKADGDIDAKTDVYVHRWRPSVHMPRWASRLTLCVKRVWVEQVQDISIQDAYAEGIYCVMEQRTNCFAPGVQGKYPTQERAFRALWDSIYAAKGYSWDTNPYVWACEFEVSNE